MNCIQLYNVNFVINCYCNLLVGREGGVDSATIVLSSSIFHPSFPHLRIETQTIETLTIGFIMYSTNTVNTDKKSNYWQPHSDTI